MVNNMARGTMGNMTNNMANHMTRGQVGNMMGAQGARNMAGGNNMLYGNMLGGPITGGITRDHVTGALVGVGIVAAGYYIYKKNQSQVDAFMKKQGINLPNNMGKDYRMMSVVELMETKELLEDILAEKQININAHIDIEK